jgi:hypothetical protein
VRNGSAGLCRTSAYTLEKRSLEDFRVARRR